MKKYFAIDAYGIRFLEVEADDEDEARRRIREQLGRLRERHWLKLWEDCGERVDGGLK